MARPIGRAFCLPRGDGMTALTDIALLKLSRSRDADMAKAAMAELRRRSVRIEATRKCSR